MNAVRDTPEVDDIRFLGLSCNQWPPLGASTIEAGWSRACAVFAGFDKPKSTDIPKRDAGAPVTVRKAMVK